MRRSLLILTAALGFAAIGSFGAWAHDTRDAQPARPGSINYVEGKASIGTQELGPNSAGTIELEKGQTLTTEAGKVEILLTPGVFLRVADNSSVRMVSPEPGQYGRCHREGSRGHRSLGYSQRKRHQNQPGRYQHKTAEQRPI